MPHIRIRALDETIIKKLSVELPTELATLMQTSADNFSVEMIATTFYKNGQVTQGDPMIEILWFERGQEIQNKSAQRITEIVKTHSNAEYIAVVFTALPKQSYYENGTHF